MERAAGVIFLLIFMILIFGVLILTFAGMWKTFQKAGKPGWGAIVPIYNIVLMTEIVGKPTWWVVLCLIPYVSVVFQIIIAIEMGKAYGKGAGFGVGLAFLPMIFYPILGFGDAEYVGPGGVPVGGFQGQQGQGGGFDEQF
ncbi:MAG: signal peptidase I [Bacteroidia bacterium]|nr:signal peptidase I [Bacteroidia bacterium]